MDENVVRARMSADGQQPPEPPEVDMAAYVVDHIDEAVENGWVLTYYQPVVRTLTGKVCGFEALARWKDPVYGLLPPITFIPPLEEASQIHKLDLYMIQQVCRQIRLDIDAGRHVVPVSFNLSRLDFELCDVYAGIEEAVRAYEVPRNLINIEITESVFGADPAFMTTIINRLHDSGYQVWMDDFGSAYSSLNVLKDFECDELKIDMEFLNRFGDRSRTIIASVVDMSKRLGVLTLAEGVETEEHSEFLRHIGCEKQQGYFYGRPEPYSEEYMKRLDAEMGIEPQSERLYYQTIGGINTLSLSERDFLPDNKSKRYVTSMPLGILEYDGKLFHLLDYNDPFVEALQGLGIPDIPAAEDFINDPRNLPARNLRRITDTIEDQRYARLDFMMGQLKCVMRVRFVASHASRITLLVTIESAQSTLEQHRSERMEDAFESLYSIYEHVDIMHIEKDYSEPIYSQASLKYANGVPSIREAVQWFAENELFPADRERYLEFIDLDTLKQRIRESGQNFIVGLFRIRQQGGEFAWKLIAVIRVLGKDDTYLLCVRDTKWENDALLQTIYEQGDDDELPAVQNRADMTLSDGSLWRAAMQVEQFGVFWKDTERKFVGCNQYFLDFYGFESVDEILGKTDEDMGWHVDPVPFKTDELQVLEKGEVIVNAHGQCIAKGVLHNIVANKRPVYRNGRIVGLVGFFMDADSVSEESPMKSLLGMVSYSDPVTETLNYIGLDAATGNYIEAYKKTGLDFAMVMLDIEDFEHKSDTYGYEYGDKVLKAAARAIRKVVGSNCVLGHLYADRFVVLRQGGDPAEMDALSREIRGAVESITEVDGEPCSIFARCAIANYSEVNDFDSFKQLGRDRLHELKEQKRRF